MNLIAGKLYDPAVAVSKATTSAIAMTALDTTNLRLSVTVPAHGMVLVRLKGSLHGATTLPQIVLGVMEGATVRGRAAAMLGGGNIAATSIVACWAEFLVTGLTPGAVNWDAAYGVETVVASTGLKYGGPNNTSANDAFGGFAFEVWDPQPMKAGLDGGVNVTQVAGTAQTAGDICARLPAALVSGRMDSSVGAMASNVLTAAAINASALNGKGDWNVGKTGYTLTQSFPTNFASLSITAGGLVDVTQTAADKVWGTAARVLTAGTNIVLAKGTGVTGFTDLDAAGVRSAVGLASANLDTQIGSISAGSGLDAAGVRAAIGLASANLDTQISTLSTAVGTRLATAGYTAPDNTGISTLLTRLSAGRATNLDSLDATVSSRLASASYTAPDNTGIGTAATQAAAAATDAAAIKAKTDSLTFTVPGKLDSNITAINGVTVTGSGTAGSPWGP